MDDIKAKLKRQRFWYFFFSGITMLSAFVIMSTILFLILRWICRNCVTLAVIFDYPYNIITYGTPVFLVAAFFAWLNFDDYNGLDNEQKVEGKDGELVVLNKKKM